MIVFYDCEHCDGKGVKKFFFLTLGVHVDTRGYEWRG